jgi:hypothetical protein
MVLLPTYICTNGCSGLRKYRGIVGNTQNVIVETYLSKLLYFHSFYSKDGDSSPLDDGCGWIQDGGSGRVASGRNLGILTLEVFSKTG